MKTIKIGSICVIHLIDKEIVENYIFQSEIKILGITFRKAGFRWGALPVESVKEIESSGNMFVDDFRVWYKPRIFLDLLNGMTHRFVFENYEQAERFSAMIKCADSHQWLDCDERRIK